MKPVYDSFHMKTGLTLARNANRTEKNIATKGNAAHTSTTKYAHRRTLDAT